MKINGSKQDTLSLLASCPFADRLELAALAETKGSTVADLLRSRPVSIQWLRILVDRLDSLAVVYRLASTVASVAHPVGLGLYRSGPLDAAMTLPGGRTVGIFRQGHAVDRTAFSRRMWKLRDAPRPGTVLVLVTDEVRLRYARKMVPRTVEALLTLERDAVLAAPEDEVWRPAASGPAASLRNALGRLEPGGGGDPGRGPAPDDWRNVTGGRSRQLLRNLEHTSAVHAFVAALARQAHALGWELSQIDPPRRASRHFSHEGGQRSVNPDAFGVLRRGPASSQFFLEWERPAVRPSTMAMRLAPYLRYYSTHSPIDDHGATPSVLIVFDDDIAASNFQRVAREEMGRSGVAVPLWVSHSAVIDALGPLGRAWRTPEDPEPAHVLINR